MDRNRIARMNNMLAERLGRNEFGEPNWKWILNTELLHPMRVPGLRENRTPAGIILMEPQYVLRPQYLPPGSTLKKPLRCWVLARWTPPEPEDSWRAKFGYSMEWPKRGFYFHVQPLSVGAEPTLSFTEEIISVIKHSESMTTEEKMEAEDRRIAEAERTRDSEIRAEIRDALPAFGRVPGAAGPNDVVIGGFSEQ